MHKAIHISLLLLSFFTVTQAQKKIIYEDTALLQKDEPVTVDNREVPEATDTAAIDAPAEEFTETVAVIDTSLIKNNLDIRHDSVISWRNQKEYGYTQYLDSLLRSQQKKKEHEKPSEPGMLNDILGSGIVSVLLWAFVICFVGFILYQLFLSGGGFRRRSKKAKDIIAEVEEEVITPESDFDGLIRQALQSGNYRQAIRYQYLRSLHQLAAAGLVTLAPDKTNFQYVSELGDAAQRQAFVSLTLHYEYVWYGEFDISKEIYDKIETTFINFNQKI